MQTAMSKSSWPPIATGMRHDTTWMEKKTKLQWELSLNYALTSGAPVRET